MLEPLVNSNPMNGGEIGGIPQLHGSGDGNEEGLTVLPRHTKVIVTGNNRTKSVLVGLEGVVKKAVGLGGWHWLVISLPSCDFSGINFVYWGYAFWLILFWDSCLCFLEANLGPVHY